MKYKYAPEWETQNGTIAIFPKKDSDWGCCFDEVSKSFLDFLTKISKYQKVYLILEEKIEINIANIEIIKDIKTNDTWARDSLFLRVEKENKNYYINYQFNSWGGKFDFDFDNKISERLSEKGFIEKNNLINIPLIIEGGAIETNGETLLITESSTINSNRNQENSKLEVELSLKKYLGVSKIIWLNNSYLAGDDTDGHIDMLARFANKNTILYSLDNIGDELKLKLPNMKYIKLPNPNFSEFPATYLNFIFVNGAVIIPIYNLKSDSKALSIFKQVFQDREIISVDSRSFIKQGGSLHCLTMQI